MLGRGDTSLPDVGLEEQGEGLLAGGDRVADGAVVAVEGALQQPGPESGGMGVFSQDLAGFGGAGRGGDPLQDVLDRAAGERGGVEVGLDDLGCAGCVVTGRRDHSGRRQ
jgi:hypothetical protein